MAARAFLAAILLLAASIAAAAAQVPSATAARLAAYYPACTIYAPQTVFSGAIPGVAGAAEVVAYTVEGCDGSNHATRTLAVLSQGGIVPLPVMRANVETAEVRGGEIVVGMVSPGPADAECCWSVHSVQVYRVGEGRLERVR